MGNNQFGRVFQVSTFGESHGPAMGALIDGCPAGVIWKQEVMDQMLARRRPGNSAVTSSRNEPDQVQILSGVFDGKTLGTPIAAVIFNQDARSSDYTAEKLATRPGHATDLWQEKFGHSDFRGSGRASGRETVSRVIGGAIARMFVQQLHSEVNVEGVVDQIGPIEVSGEESLKKIEDLLMAAKVSGESYGGSVRLTIAGAPRNLGQPVFAKLKSELAAAFLSTGATMGFEIGAGFASASASGNEFHKQVSRSSNYGGIRGGISTGEPIVTRVAFKPTSSRGEMATQGRHDPCIVPRAIPVLEAMAWLVLADQLLLTRLDQV